MKFEKEINVLERISNQELIHIVESMRDYDEVV